MLELSTIRAILDSLHVPVLYADTYHVIRYMNRKAIERYRGGADLIGTSLLDCHNENSQKRMIEILAELKAGREEVLYLVEETRTVTMRAIRGQDGSLLGYYEWYGPPTPTRG
jgi:DUF438 domain-containing protein